MHEPDKGRGEARGVGETALDVGDGVGGAEAVEGDDAGAGAGEADEDREGVRVVVVGGGGGRRRGGRRGGGGGGGGGVCGPGQLAGGLAGRLMAGGVGAVGGRTRGGREDGEEGGGGDGGGGREGGRGEERERKRKSRAHSGERVAYRRVDGEKQAQSAPDHQRMREHVEDAGGLRASPRTGRSADHSWLVRHGGERATDDAPCSRGASCWRAWTRAWGSGGADAPPRSGAGAPWAGARAQRERTGPEGRPSRRRRSPGGRSTEPCGSGEEDSGRRHGPARRARSCLSWERGGEMSGRGGRQRQLGKGEAVGRMGRRRGARGRGD